MADKVAKQFGPVAMSATLTTDIYQGGGGSALVWDVVKHIHVVNKTAVAATFSLWLGATGANNAGTELFSNQSVSAYGTFDYYCSLKMLSTDFLVGGASGATTLTIYGEGTQGVV